MTRSVTWYLRKFGFKTKYAYEDKLPIRAAPAVLCKRKLCIYILSSPHYKKIMLSNYIDTKWETCTTSCGYAKNRKTRCERLPRWLRVSWVAWGPSDTVIFEREAVRALQKNVPVFEVLAMETLPRDSASPEDCLHVGALQVLVTELRFRVDNFYELMLYLLWGEIDVKGKKAELTERLVWSRLFLHTYKPNPIARRPS